MFAHKFVWGEALERLRTTREGVGVDEVLGRLTELAMAVVVQAFDGRLLDRSVHAFDLAVGPRGVRFGHPALDGVLEADAIEPVKTQPLPRVRSCVTADRRTGRRYRSERYGDEELKLALGCLNLGNVDGEIALERLLWRFIAFDTGQPGDGMNER